MMSNEALDRFKVFAAYCEGTGKWPRPVRRADGASDQAPAGLSPKPRDLREARYPLTRNEGRQHLLPEAAGLDDDLDDARLCDLIMEKVREAGASDEENQKLEEILSRLTRNPAEAATDAEQTMVTGSMTKQAMDSRACEQYQAGKLSTRDYEEQILRGIRPTAVKGAVPFHAMFGRHVRQGY
jgi:hypothetical protein